MQEKRCVMNGQNVVRKIILACLGGLLTVLASQGQALASTYDLAAWYGSLSDLDQKVYAMKEMDEWGEEVSLFWERSTTEDVALPHINQTITGADKKFDSWGKIYYLQDTVSGRILYKTVDKSDPSAPPAVRYRYDFVTPPTTPTSPSGSSFDNSNLALPSPILPAVLDTATPYSHTFANKKPDGTGKRVDIVTVSTDDNGGAFHSIIDPIHHDYDAELSGAWQATPTLLQGLLRVTMQIDMYYVGGDRVRMVRTDYLKQGVGMVARNELTTNLATGQVVGDTRQGLLAYALNNETPVIMPGLGSRQIQIWEDGTTTPVAGTYAWGIAYDYYNGGTGGPTGGTQERDEMYFSVAVLSDGGVDTGLYTLFYFLDDDSGAPDPIELHYTAPAYATHTYPNVDLSQTQPPYYLTTHSIDVTFHVKDENGVGIAGASVETRLSTGGDDGPGGEGHTDGNGNVTLALHPDRSYGIEVWLDDSSLYMGGVWQGEGLNAPAYTTANVTTNWPGWMHTFSDGDTLELVLTTGIILEGTVTASDGTTGVAGIRVNAQPEWDSNTNSSTGSWQSTTTANDGTYRMKVSDGTYKVQFETTYWDYQTGQQVIVPGGYIGGFADGNDGVIGDWMQAEIFAINDNTTVDVSLNEGIAISGVVVDQNYTPITGRMNVNVHTRDWTNAYWGEVAHDASGAFNVTVEPGLDYIVEFWPGWDPTTGMEDTTYSGGTYIVHPDPLNNGSGNPLFEAGYDMNEPATIPNIVANNVTQDEITAYHTMLDPSGTLAGTLTTLGKSDHIAGMIMGINEPHIVTTLTVDADIHILPQVLSGTPLKGRLRDSNNAPIARAWVNGMVASAETDADGCFTLKMPNSPLIQNSITTFQVDVHPGWNNGTQDTSFIGGVVTGTATPFTLTPMWDAATQFRMDFSDWPATDLSASCGNGTAGLDILVEAGVAITGTVTDGTNPLPNIWVNAWSKASGFGSGAITGQDGSFSIPVQGSAQGVLYEVGIWDPNYIAPKPKSIIVSSDSTVPASLAFVLGNGNAIKGRIIDADGNPQRWMWVDIYSADRSSWFGVATNRDGQYSASVPNGSYYVKVEGWGETGQKLFQTKYWRNAGNERSATLVTVNNADVEGINFRMTSGHTILGTISGLAQGDKAWLDAWSETTMGWAGTEITGNGSGSDSFTLRGMAQATDYRVGIWADGYTSGHYGGTPGGAASAPVDWSRATLISTANGNVTGVNLLVDSGGTLTVTVNGLQENDTIDANLWSETTMRGGWGNAQANAQGVATIIIEGIDTTADDYRLFVGSWSNGYKNGFYQGTVPSDLNAPGTLSNWDQATFIDMGLNNGEVAVAVTMSAGSTISGTITGLPDDSRAWLDAWSESTHSWSGTEVTGTGSPVAYELKGLDPADDYRVSISGEEIAGGFYSGGGAPASWDRAIMVDIDAVNQTVPDIDFTLTQGRSIGGTITGLQNGEWAWLDAWSNATYSWSGTQVTAGGSESDDYTIRGLLAGDEYEVGFFSEGYVHQRQFNIDITDADNDSTDFTASTGGSISGDITGLNAYETVWLDANSPSGNGWGGVNALADSNGAASYTIQGLADASDYVVSLSSAKGWFVYSDSGPQYVWDQHTDVAVSGGADVTGKDFDITNNQTYTLSGTISGLADGKVVEVFAWSPNSGGRTQRTGNGTYTLKDLPAGDYTVEVMARGYVAKHTATGITVNGGVVDNPTWSSSRNNLGTVAVAGNVSGLDLVMSAGYSISGTVFDTNGSTPLADVSVNAWSEVNAIGRGAMTNASGAYTIRGLPNGDYRVDAWTQSGEASRDVTLADANLTGQNLTIIRQEGSISGTVTNNSTPASGALIFVYNNNGSQVGTAVTNGNGDYTVGNLELDVSYRVDLYLTTNFTTTDGSTTVTPSSGNNPATADFSLPQPD